MGFASSLRFLCVPDYAFYDGEGSSTEALTDRSPGDGSPRGRERTREVAAGISAPVIETRATGRRVGDNLRGTVRFSVDLRYVFLPSLQGCLALERKTINKSPRKMFNLVIPPHLPRLRPS